MLTGVDKASGLRCPAHPNQQHKVQGKEEKVAKADAQDSSLASTRVLIGAIWCVALAQGMNVLQGLLRVVPQEPGCHCCDGKADQVDVLGYVWPNF